MEWKLHTLWPHVLQAYEKEDEAPAAVPAEKKEKAAEKVKSFSFENYSSAYFQEFTNYLLPLQAETEAAPKKAKAPKAKK